MTCSGPSAPDSKWLRLRVSAASSMETWSDSIRVTAEPPSPRAAGKSWRSRLTPASDSSPPNRSCTACLTAPPAACLAASRNPPVLALTIWPLSHDASSASDRLLHPYVLPSVQTGDVGTVRPAGCRHSGDLSLWCGSLWRPSLLGEHEAEDHFADPLVLDVLQDAVGGEPQVHVPGLRLRSVRLGGAQ